MNAYTVHHSGAVSLTESPPCATIPHVPVKIPSCKEHRFSWRRHFYNLSCSVQPHPSWTFLQRHTGGGKRGWMVHLHLALPFTQSNNTVFNLQLPVDLWECWKGISNDQKEDALDVVIIDQIEDAWCCRPSKVWDYIENRRYADVFLGAVPALFWGLDVRTN